MDTRGMKATGYRGEWHNPGEGGGHLTPEEMTHYPTLDNAACVLSDAACASWFPWAEVGAVLDLYPEWVDSDGDKHCAGEPSHRLTVGPRKGIVRERF